MRKATMPTPLKINPELLAFIPPTTAHERETLRPALHGRIHEGSRLRHAACARRGRKCDGVVTGE